MKNTSSTGIALYSTLDFIKLVAILYSILSRISVTLIPKFLQKPFSFPEAKMGLQFAASARNIEHQQLSFQVEII